MASMTSISSVLICTTRMWVAMPRNSTTGSSTSAIVVVCDPLAVLDRSASVMIAADSALRTGQARQLVQHRRGQLLQGRERQLHLRLDSGHLRNAQASR